MNYTNYPFYISFDSIPVFNFCTTRYGGVSLLPYESLNLGFNTNDRQDTVKKNRIICSERTGIPIESFVFLNQAHTDKVLYVDKSDCGKALQVPVLQADAMFTDQPGICLAITLADCVGIIVYDTEKHIAGVSHSGWRGCHMNICGKLVENMVNRCGCDPFKLIVCISPSICYRCFCVSDGIAEKFAVNYGKYVIYERDKFHIDLKGIVVFQLMEIGIRKNSIFVSDICTAENTHIFYSHRAEKNTGRFIFGIYLNERKEQ